jgi:hypothetical protein
MTVPHLDDLGAGPGAGPRAARKHIPHSRTPVLLSTGCGGYGTGITVPHLEGKGAGKVLAPTNAIREFFERGLPCRFGRGHTTYWWT